MSFEENGEKIDAKMVIANYGRSCAVTQCNKVYIWGQGFKQEKIFSPRKIFEDKVGIDLLKFGFNYGLYI